MRYRLIVLTHGDPYRTLPRAVGSFAKFVSPEPTEAILVCDGDTGFAAGDFLRASPWDWQIDETTNQQGFCAATRRAWQVGANPRGDISLVFYLEHDFEFLRPVDLRDAATVLAENPQIAQVALMRDAVNPAEKAAGGLFESRPSEYVKQVERPDDFETGRTIPWLQHDRYFTTNPSLMTRSFMEANPWPPYDEQCEGRFGIDLREKGFRFAALGEGEPWVRHIGERDGFGY